jgi:hypothetical protein
MRSPVDRVLDRLASQSSRRGFLSAVARGCVITAATLSGAAGGLLAGGAGAVFATLACCKCQTFQCTTTYCGQDACPSGTSTTYTGYCCLLAYRTFYECYDCTNSSGAYVCTFGGFGGNGCPSSPARVGNSGVRD